MEGAVGRHAADPFDAAIGTSDDIDLPELVDPGGQMASAIRSGQVEGRWTEDGLDFGLCHAYLDLRETRAESILAANHNDSQNSRQQQPQRDGDQQLSTGGACHGLLRGTGTFARPAFCGNEFNGRAKVPSHVEHIGWLICKGVPAPRKLPPRILVAGTTCRSTTR